MEQQRRMEAERLAQMQQLSHQDDDSAAAAALAAQTGERKVGRNDPCPCGSGKIRSSAAACTKLTVACAAQDSQPFIGLATMKKLQIAVGIIRNENNEIFITRRAADAHGDNWSFLAVKRNAERRTGGA